MQRPTKRYTIKQFMDTSRVSGIAFSHDERSILVSSNKSGIFNVFSVPVAGRSNEATDLLDRRRYSRGCLFPE